MFQSPSLRGSGRFVRGVAYAAYLDEPFQSPSLRGSGRFARRKTKQMGSFVLVSIPFIAGQWSLHGPGARQAAWEPSFNPLHCGAVVASDRDRAQARAAKEVFQSPSLRGSGRFSRPGRRPPATMWWFQSPSLRGSGRFRTPPSPEGGRAIRVSIPFIAGQWSLLFPLWTLIGDSGSFQSPSLRGSGRFRLRASEDQLLEEMFQSPSLRGSGRFTLWGGTPSSTASSFNPLHCGAVVASRSARSAKRRTEQFQSPSLRGSGRFSYRSVGAGRLRCARFNPLHCGAVVASRAAENQVRKEAAASIPFIAGQWSLLKYIQPLPPGCRVHFNPLHCGAVVASPESGRR